MQDLHCIRMKSKHSYKIWHRCICVFSVSLKFRIVWQKGLIKALLPTPCWRLFIRIWAALNHCSAFAGPDRVAEAAAAPCWPFLLFLLHLIVFIWSFKEFHLIHSRPRCLSLERPAHCYFLFLFPVRALGCGSIRVVVVTSLPARRPAAVTIHLWSVFWKKKRKKRMINMLSGGFFENPWACQWRYLCASCLHQCCFWSAACSCCFYSCLGSDDLRNGRTSLHPLDLLLHSPIPPLLHPLPHYRSLQLATITYLTLWVLFFKITQLKDFKLQWLFLITRPTLMRCDI